MVQKIVVKDTTFQHLMVLKTNRKKRHRAGEFLVEGVRSIKKAVENRWQIRSLIFMEGTLSDWANRLLQEIPTEVNYVLPRELMQELSGKSDLSEVLAIVQMKENTLTKEVLSDNPFLVLFDRPSNKGNLGTLIRSCDAFGADGLIVTGHGVDLYDPHVVVSAMGSFFSVPVFLIRETNTLRDLFASLKEQFADLRIIGTTAHKEQSVTEVDFTTPVILLLGNETNGLSWSLKEHSDQLCSIPMAAHSYASSLNVSCAASIVMYEVVRQRGVYT